MASLTKKIVNGRPYYYLRETARVGGRSKVVRTTYLGRAEDIEQRLFGDGRAQVGSSRSFGAVAAALKLCSELEVATAIDRALDASGSPAPWALRRGDDHAGGDQPCVQAALQAPAGRLARPHRAGEALCRPSAGR